MEITKLFYQHIKESPLLDMIYIYFTLLSEKNNNGFEEKSIKYQFYLCVVLIIKENKRFIE